MPTVGGLRRCVRKLSWRPQSFRGHARPCAASMAAPNTVRSHAACPVPAPSSAAITACPVLEIGAISARPYGTCPGGYNVNDDLCGSQTATHSGNRGPVLRGRQPCTVTRQAASPTPCFGQSSGRSGTNRSPTGWYTVNTNGRVARGRKPEQTLSIVGPGLGQHVLPRLTRTGSFSKPTAMRRGLCTLKLIRRSGTRDASRRALPALAACFPARHTYRSLELRSPSGMRRGPHHAVIGHATQQKRAVSAPPALVTFEKTRRSSAVVSVVNA